MISSPQPLQLDRQAGHSLPLSSEKLTILTSICIAIISGGAAIGAHFLGVNEIVGYASEGIAGVALATLAVSTCLFLMRKETRSLRFEEIQLTVHTPKSLFEKLEEKRLTIFSDQHFVVEHGPQNRFVYTPDYFVPPSKAEKRIEFPNGFAIYNKDKQEIQLFSQKLSGQYLPPKGYAIHQLYQAGEVGMVRLRSLDPEQQDIFQILNEEAFSGGLNEVTEENHLFLENHEKVYGFFGWNHLRSLQHETAFNLIDPEFVCGYGGLRTFDLETAPAPFSISENFGFVASGSTLIIAKQEEDFALTSKLPCPVLGIAQYANFLLLVTTDGFLRFYELSPKIPEEVARFSLEKEIDTACTIGVCEETLYLLSDKEKLLKLDLRTILSE